MMNRREESLMNGRGISMINRRNMEIKDSVQYLSNEVKFYTIAELVELLGWSLATVQKLFNDPNFPATDFGKNKVVESHALIEYFSSRHERDSERYWRA